MSSHIKLRYTLRGAGGHDTPRDRGGREPPEAVGVGKDLLLEAAGARGPATALILDFWPRELRENTFLLL